MSLKRRSNEQWIVRSFLTPMGGWNFSLIQGKLEQSLCYVPERANCIASNFFSLNSLVGRSYLQFLC